MITVIHKSKLKDQQNGHSKTKYPTARNGAKTSSAGTATAEQTTDTSLHRFREYLSVKDTSSGW
jgi:hypothetical protein